MTRAHLGFWPPSTTVVLADYAPAIRHYVPADTVVVLAQYPANGTVLVQDTHTGARHEVDAQTPVWAVPAQHYLR